jgi:hypothetical protein
LGIFKTPVQSKKESVMFVFGNMMSLHQQALALPVQTASYIWCQDLVVSRISHQNTYTQFSCAFSGKNAPRGA